MAEFEIEYYVVVCEKYLKKVVCPYSLYSQNIRQKVTGCQGRRFLIFGNMSNTSGFYTIHNILL